MSERRDLLPLARASAETVDIWPEPGGGSDDQPSFRRSAPRRAVWAAILASLDREIEEGRGFNWLPVLFGIGILLYFALPHEPSAAALVLLTVAAALVAWRSRARAGLFRAVIAITFVVAGMATTKLHTDWLAGPKLPRELTRTVSGWVGERRMAVRGGVRVTLHVKAIEGLDAQETPERVRITIRSRADDIQVGDGIEMLARLRPPSGPVMPGGYDFGRANFYAGIGASGFAYGAAHPVDIGPPPFSIRMGEPLSALREIVRQRVTAALPGDHGRIAAALIMGDQGGISENTQEAMRASGLGHVLSISGLHMALIAGGAFGLLRALFALSPALALYWPIKKWAALGALAVATFYLGLSGAEVATQRSYIMLSIMLVAVLLDRRAITLRNVALSAMIVLLLSPESVLTASFQMSFAATVALVAAYEAISVRRQRRLHLADRRDRGVLGVGMDAGMGMFVTSLVAGVATAPFAIFHFQRVAPLTLLANLAAMPAIGIIVMPMVLLTVIMMPFGLESWPLAIMRWGLDWMLAVAAWTTDWTGDMGGIHAVPVLALLLVVGGFLWLTLWQEKWRLLGLPVMLAALPVALAAPSPDVLVDSDGRAVAVRGVDGRYVIIGGEGARFAVEYWLRADADMRAANAESLREGIGCDPTGCIGRLADGSKVALVMKPGAFAEDCRRAAIVVSRLEAPPFCADAPVLIDAGQLRRHGAHAVYRDAGGEPGVARYRVIPAYPDNARPWMPAYRPTDEDDQ